MFRTIALAAALASGCGQPDDGAGGGSRAEPQPPPPRAPADQLHAQLHPTSGAPVSGMITFAERGGAIEVSVQVNGLAPYARHGLSIHAGTGCGRTGEGIGRPFEPAGDLGHLEADEMGHATLERRWDRVSLRVGPTALLGHTVAVSGRAGKPIACGVIE